MSVSNCVGNSFQNVSKEPVSSCLNLDTNFAWGTEDFEQMAGRGAVTWG